MDNMEIRRFPGGGVAQDLLLHVVPELMTKQYRL